jgi:cell division protease FtsH
MFVGLGANRMREMFSDAREKRPCIIFIDEIDAVGRARTSGPGAHPEADQTLNAMLVELQGLNTGNQNFGLWILAATNRVDILDKALLRPGRFTWKIKVDPPNLDGRVAILNVHTKKREVPLSDNVDFVAIASVLAGLTGADLENVVNETALYAEELAEREAEPLRAKQYTKEKIDSMVKATVSQEDFFEGLLRHLMGLKREVNLTFDEIFNTVVHEAGHAIAIAYERFLGRTDEIVRFIAVEPRGSAGGLTFKTPDRDAFGKTLEEVDADCVCGFGGSAAQLVFLNVKDSGPDNDFEVVGQNIYRAIGRWYGSEKLGAISLGQRGQTAATEMGSAQKDMIDAECNLKTKVLYAKTWWIMNLFIRSETVWTMFWELLELKIMRQDRFAELFEAAMKEVQAHPTWNDGSLEKLMETVKLDPYGWSPAPLDVASRTYLDNRIAALRARYEALSASEQA